jgi:hypothetical protein
MGESIYWPRKLIRVVKFTLTQKNMFGGNEEQKNYVLFSRIVYVYIFV